MPTLAGFLVFIRSIMAIDPLYLPDDSPVIGYALTVAQAIVNQALVSVPPIYTLAVYNLAGDNVINFAQDQTGRTYFVDLRETWKINSFTAGVIASSGDQATSQSTLNPDFMRGFTLANLQNLKTPYGRQYLGFAQAYGPTIWGLS